MPSIERVVLVTGAGSGIGAATALRVAASDTALVIHTRKNAEGLAKVASDCRHKGASVETATSDLADPDTAGELVALARSKFGRVDQIVSNAGSARRAQFGALTEAELRADTDLIGMAFFRLVNGALPNLTASAWGRVIAVSSFAAHTFGANGTIFPATAFGKAGLEGLAKALAWQLAPSGTTVNCVVPGYTRKDPSGHAALNPDAWETARLATPMQKLGEPADVAAAIAFLLSREAGHVTGQTLHIDGGLSLL